MSPNKMYKIIHLWRTPDRGRDQAHPSHGYRRMILLAVPQGFGKSQNGFLHPPGSLGLPIGPYIVPGQPDMIRVMKLSIWVDTALHPVGQFRLRQSGRAQFIHIRIVRNRSILVNI